ncbi:CdaR family transcriptional regulator [Austwickia sp. TVS 96-490-7B]|uniref:PucR family transcriptional regulator n=1 Tax=Austwickia sp. TVS 96-490-7B TaxID=2830843 RepID=UPI0021025BC9|nr:helix-turn-helix domain-containing protein [Austwickia sp. TVS 96-490-7B]
MGSPRASEETSRAVERSAGRLTTAAYRHMESHLEWYLDLSAQERSWVGTVVQSGFASFVDWYVHSDTDKTDDHATASIFAAAPRGLTRTISLRQTLDLLRTVVDVVEDHIPELAAAGEETALREDVLRYSRDIAFAAAQVYAGAAETRGAWDARLESLVVDAVVRGESPDELTSRAAALGWDRTEGVVVVMGAVPTDAGERALERMRTAAGRVGVDLLISAQESRLIVIAGGVTDPEQIATALAPAFGPGPVVVGPRVSRLHSARGSARAAAAALRAAPAWAGAPRPVRSDDLLPERVLVGDTGARSYLIRHVFTPLRKASGASLEETCTTYLACGRSLEATARALFVHPNTVRYRLGRITALTGYDPTAPREAYVLQTALAVGRLDEAATSASSDAEDLPTPT